GRRRYLPRFRAENFQPHRRRGRRRYLPRFRAENFQPHRGLFCLTVRAPSGQASLRSAGVSVGGG
ncbi:MAG: hypothetical protein ACI4WT_14260, partial [Oligosphaeraceae bacterium]